MKKPDLLVLIAIWEFIAAFGALIGVAAIAAFAFPGALDRVNTFEFSRQAHWGAVFGLSIAIFVLLCYIAISVAGGIGLLAGKEWGRVVSLVHSALSLFWIPFGTVIGALSIVYLVKQDVKDYFQPPKPAA
jgi:hypothetical protein